MSFERQTIFYHLYKSILRDEQFVTVPINPNINCEVILDFFHSSKALSNVIFTMGKVNTNTIS